jgi:uncharacterized protein (TIGR00251 family)
MIDLKEHPQGWLLPVRAQPGAKRSAVLGEQAGALKAAVTAPAQDGRANQALLELLRDALHLKRSQLELYSGEASRNKKLLIRGVSRSELEQRLASLA